MEDSKIHLSPSETRLMQDAGVILTKITVLSKVKLLLESIQARQQQFVISQSLDDLEIFRSAPKISRGENYLGLPWMILDFPRISKNHDLLLVRTMFWWGNFFSSTLHAGGKYRDIIEYRMEADGYSNPEFHIGINADPWMHHFEEDNYRSVQAMSQEERRSAAQASGHFKMAMKWPLIEWDKSEKIGFENWKSLLQAGKLVP